MNLTIPRLQKQADQAADNATADLLNAQATDLTVEISRMDAQSQSLEQRSHSLLQEIKKVGPDLKEARQKLRKEWIPYWIGHTTEFRPTTKMPQFRLSQDEIQAVAAFIWQDSLPGPPLEKQPAGNPTHGKELLESRGCLACHAIGEGSKPLAAHSPQTLAASGKRKITITLCAGCTTRASERVRIAHTRSEILGPRITPSTICRTFSISITRAARMTAMNWSFSSRPSCPACAFRSRIRATSPVSDHPEAPDASYAAADYMDDPKLKPPGQGAGPSLRLRRMPRNQRL